MTTYLDDEKVLVEADMIREEIKDFFNLTSELTYKPNVSKETICEYVQNAQKKLTLLEKKMQSKWFLGHKLTFLDFMAYDIIDHQRILFPSILDEFKKIESFMEAFEDLDGIKDFMKSNRYKKFPLWSERSFLGRTNDNLPIYKT